MKNHEIFRLREALDGVSNLKGIKFAYSVLKNKKLLDDEIAILQKTVEMTEAYKDYETQRVTLCEMNSERDEQGKPVIVNNQYSIIDRESFEKEIEELKAKFADVINERIKQVTEYDNIMVEESDIVDKLSKVKVEFLPEELSANQLEALKEMIEE